MNDKNFHFRLYVCSASNEVSEIVDEIHEMLDDYTNGRYELEVKNLFENDNNANAVADGVFSVPALLRKLPVPAKHIVGDLTNAKAVLLLLDKNGNEQT